MNMHFSSIEAIERIDVRAKRFDLLASATISIQRALWRTREGYYRNLHKQAARSAVMQARALRLAMEAIHAA